LKPVGVVSDVSIGEFVKSFRALREVSEVSSPLAETRHERGSAPAKERVLPAYDNQLSDFHRAFEPELQRILDSLPLTPAMKVLDLACGDGFYTRRIADRLGPGGSVTGDCHARVR